MNKLTKREEDKLTKNILQNHFEEFKEKRWHKVRREMRHQVESTVRKALDCGNIEKNYIKYKCLDCGNEHIHGFTCKSKFCTKCGRKYSLEWSEKQVENMLNVPHRHAVFTIPEELRNYFYRRRDLIKNLQDATYEVLSYFYKERVKGNHEVGSIAVVHTFGSDLKWNPHVHVLFTEGGIDKDSKWFKQVPHIPFKYLRKSWQKQLFEIIRNNFKDKVTKILLNKLYKQNPEGFYVNAERGLNNMKYAARYIGRYLARPAIADYRITEYDGKTVTFWYENKNPKKEYL
jgi:DNA-directed RNA polymerase subunit RPC12/RpoP